MTSRNWVRLFLTTLLVGGFTTAIGGFIVRWNEFQPYFTEFRAVDIVLTLIWLIGMGILFSLISQLGFFAYLTIHRFGLGIFKSVSLWNSVQAVLILFALFDIVDWRYEKFAKVGESIVPYLGTALFIFIIGLIAAWIKMKQTNREAFVPALFVMIVVTMVEWVPAVRINERGWLYLMLFALQACNVYQLLVLHKLNAKSEQERRQRQNSSNQKTGKPQSNKPNINIPKKPSV